MTKYPLIINLCLFQSVQFRTTGLLPPIMKKKKYHQAHPDQFGICEIDRYPEIIIAKGKAQDSIKMVRNGYLFSTVKDPVSDSAELKQLITRYAQYKFLLELNALQM